MDENGGRFYTALAFDDATIRRYTINSMTPDDDFDVVVGMETMGLPLGVLIANKLDLKFIAMREEGKIPVPEERLLRADSGYENRDKILTIDKTQINSGCKILLVDDWIESGKQITAAIKLLREADASVKAISVIGTDINFTHPKLLDDIKLYKAIQ